MLLVHGITDTWRTLGAAPADAGAPSRHAGDHPARPLRRPRARRRRARPRWPTSSTRRSATWTPPASRPRTWSATRSAAGSSLELAARGRARSVVAALPRRRLGARATPGRSRATGSSSPSQRSLALTKPRRAQPRVPASRQLARPRRPRLRSGRRSRAALAARADPRRRRLPGGAAAADRVAGRTATPTWRDRLPRADRLGHEGPAAADPARLRPLPPAVPQAEWIEIPGAGHLPQIDHPERDGRAGPRGQLRRLSEQEVADRVVRRARLLQLGHVPAVELQVTSLRQPALDVAHELESGRAMS